VPVYFLSPSQHPLKSFILTQVSDGTKTVMILAGELLKQAENLLIMGLHPSEIIAGYDLACRKAMKELESTVLLLSLPFYLSLPLPSSHSSFILEQTTNDHKQPYQKRPSPPH